MQIENELNRQLLTIAKKYPRFIFSAGMNVFDTEDELFVRYFNIGIQSHPKTIERVEIIFVKEPSLMLHGHYIRFYGLHKRLKNMLRRIKNFMGTPKLYFSDDFREASLVSSDEKIFLRLQRRELNFYLTHLSISFDDNEKIHGSFLAEVKNNFLEFLKIPNIDNKSKKAIRKLFYDLNDR